MQLTAHEIASAHISLAQNLTDGDTNGRGIDCRGYYEALAFVATGLFGGTANPTADVHWEESADNTTFADITGAAHTQVLYDNDKIVTTVNLTNTALTIAAQPANPGHVSVDVVDSTSSITAGTVYIVGTRPPRPEDGPGAASQAQTELLSGPLVAGSYRSTGIFDAITSVTTGLLSAVTGSADFATLGGGGDETIKVGIDNSGPAICHVGRINLINRKRYLRAVVDEGGTSPTGEIVCGLFLLDADRKPVYPSIVGTADFNIT